MSSSRLLKASLGGRFVWLIPVRVVLIGRWWWIGGRASGSGGGRCDTRADRDTRGDTTPVRPVAATADRDVAIDRDVALKVGAVEIGPVHISPVYVGPVDVRPIDIRAVDIGP